MGSTQTKPILSLLLSKDDIIKLYKKLEEQVNKAAAIELSAFEDNEENTLTRSNSETFVRKLSHTHKRQPFYHAQSATNSIIFGIRHYPGLVNYNSTYFIDKKQVGARSKRDRWRHLLWLCPEGNV